jgi:hypothetical protein
MRCYICNFTPDESIRTPSTEFHRSVTHLSYEKKEGRWICSDCKIAVKHDYDVSRKELEHRDFKIERVD